jgi:hypothetical protein
MFFKGVSNLYVFSSYREIDGERKDYVEDYDTDYTDKASFIDMIANIVERESGDEKFTYKIVKKLAAYMGVENKLRLHKLTGDEYWEESRKLEKKLVDSPDYKKFLEENFEKK